MKAETKNQTCRNKGARKRATKAETTRRHAHENIISRSCCTTGGPEHQELHTHSPSSLRLEISDLRFETTDLIFMFDPRPLQHSRNWLTIEHIRHLQDKLNLNTRLSNSILPIGSEDYNHPNTYGDERKGKYNSVLSFTLHYNF